MKKYILFSIIVLAALWFLGSASAQAATYYVNATTGSDGRTTFQAQNSGTPWLTIQKCANNAVAGDTCSVAAGVYNEAVSTSASGTDAAHMITFQGVGYVYITSMTIKHDWIKFDNFRMDNDGTHATRLTGDDSFITLWGNHCIVSNNFMRQGPSETNSCNGINGDIAGSHNNLITYNEMDGLRYLNIQITGDDQIASYNKIHGNIDDVFRTNKCRNCQILPAKQLF